MTLQKLKLESELKEVDRNQKVGNWAVGVVPTFKNDVVLVKRLNPPFPGLYSIVTGKLAHFPIPGDFDVWDMMVAQIGESHTDFSHPNTMPEDTYWAAIRELYEEFYANQKTILADLHQIPGPSIRDEVSSKFLESLVHRHNLREELYIIDSQTHWLMKCYSTKLFSKKFTLDSNEVSDVRFLSELASEQINPLSQFALYMTGKLNGSEIKTNISFTKVRKAKSNYCWREFPNTYMISY